MIRENDPSSLRSHLKCVAYAMLMAAFREWPDPIGTLMCLPVGGRRKIIYRNEFKKQNTIITLHTLFVLLESHPFGLEMISMSEEVAVSTSSADVWPDELILTMSLRSSAELAGETVRMSCVFVFVLVVVVVILVAGILL